jgi:hypothetical protein
MVKRDKFFKFDYPSSANVGLIVYYVLINLLIKEKQINNTKSMHQRYSLIKVLEKVLLSVNAARHFFVAKYLLYSKSIKNFVSFINLNIIVNVYEGLNRRDNPARTCISSYLPCD